MKHEPMANQFNARPTSDHFEVIFSFSAAKRCFCSGCKMITATNMLIPLCIVKLVEGMLNRMYNELLARSQRMFILYLNSSTRHFLSSSTCDFNV